MTELTPRLALPLLQAGQAQKELFHNEALALLDIVVHATVKAVGIDLPPANPQIGECWIVGKNPQAEWIGHADNIAGWSGGGWRFVRASDGMCAWCVADTLWVQHIGDTWVKGRVAAESVWISGKQVVGARRPSIAQPVAGTTIDTEARLAVSAIIATLQTHGLIGE